ncbi:hypothetical protein ABPG77_002142 [Micractinium sp. CCAP 211/92]
MADNGSAPAPSCDEVAPPTPPAAADIRCLGGGRAGPPAAAAPPPPATVSTTSPVAAAGQHAAACNAAAEEVRFDRHLALCSFTLLTATQCMSLLAWATLPGWERLQRVLSICFAASIYIFPTAAPLVYLRWRPWALAAYRVAFFAFPLLRRARSIQGVLDAEPQPGLHGALKDLLKVIWGTRLVAVFMSSLMTPLPLMPLMPHLLLQACSVAMVRANGSLCATPLLSHPATAARISSFHQAMYLASMLLPGSVGQSISPALRASQQCQQCEAFLSFLLIAAGLLLPVVVLLATEPLHSLNAWKARQQQLTHARQQGGGLAMRASGAAARMEWWAREMCGTSWLSGKLALNGFQRGLGWWLLLSMVWAAPFAVKGH